MKPTLTTIVVQGRFHAFAMAKAMIAKGAPVHVVTNYPAFIARRFGLPAENVTGCAPLGLLHRYASRWDLLNRLPVLNQALHQGFSRWSARHISRTEPVALHVFSSVALELYHQLRTFRNPIVRLLARGSEHIVDQFEDLEQESIRAGIAIDKPSPWVIRREVQEYALSDHIVTLSSFARSTFLKRGFAPDKIDLLPLATDVGQFRPAREVIEARLRRIRSQEPLQMLCTGTVCLRKGVLDFVEIARAMQGKMKFRWVGNVLAEAQSLVAANQDIIDFVPRQPEQELPRFYNDTDGYVFPTIEDGFAMVLAQARAACVPIIATENSAAPDMLEDGATGWTLPIRRADLFIERLGTWHANRESMAQMVDNLWLRDDTRDWSDVAEDFIAIVNRAVQRRVAEGLWPG